MNVMAPSPQDTLIQTHSHSDDNQYRQTGGGVVQPIPLGVIPEGDELPDIPSVMTVTKSVPPLWCLSRLGMGTLGVAEEGLGEQKELSQRLPAHLWTVRMVILGHEVSNKWA